MVVTTGWATASPRSPLALGWMLCARLTIPMLIAFAGTADAASTRHPGIRLGTPLSQLQHTYGRHLTMDKDGTGWVIPYREGAIRYDEVDLRFDKANRVTETSVMRYGARTCHHVEAALQARYGKFIDADGGRDHIMYLWRSGNSFVQYRDLWNPAYSGYPLQYRCWIKRMIKNPE